MKPPASPLVDALRAAGLMAGVLRVKGAWTETVAVATKDGGALYVTADADGYTVRRGDDASGRHTDDGEALGTAADVGALVPLLRSHGAASL